MDKVALLVAEFGFPMVLALGMGYFMWYLWKFLTLELKPALGTSQKELIKLIDQIRMLDNDLIRLQQKVDTVLEYKQTQDIIRDAEKENAFQELKDNGI